MEDSLPLIARFDTNIIKPLLDIKLGKVLGPTELQDKLRDQGKKVFVFNSHGVEHLIVLDQIEGTVLFLDKEHWSYYRGLGQSNMSSL